MSSVVGVGRDCWGLQRVGDVSAQSTVDSEALQTTSASVGVAEQTTILTEQTTILTEQTTILTEQTTILTLGHDQDSDGEDELEGTVVSQDACSDQPQGSPAVHSEEGDAENSRRGGAAGLSFHELSYEVAQRKCFKKLPNKIILDSIRSAAAR